MSEITNSEAIVQLRGIRISFEENRILKIGNDTIIVDYRTLQALDKAIEVMRDLMDGNLTDTSKVLLERTDFEPKYNYIEDDVNLDPDSEELESQIISVKK